VWKQDRIDRKLETLQMLRSAGTTANTKARVTRFQGKRAGIVGACLAGLVCPPYVLGGVSYFVVRVRQERARLREYGRG
jgi:hypothetical protein